MTTSKKQTLYKAINITAITTIVGLVMTLYGFMHAEQQSQGKDLQAVKETVIILQQTPITNQVLISTELIKAQRKQIDINTKTLAVLNSQYNGISLKLDMIYSIVKDNNAKLDRHIEYTK